MRTLIVGAGGVGGYFGGRLLEAGRDVTFLVRARRAEQLSSRGLTIRSPFGDFHHPSPPLVQAAALGELARRDPFDLVLLSCKAYDLDDAVRSMAPGVGPETAILPVLNGMRHMDVLDERFGRDAVLGGLCMIAGTVDDEGQILHLNAVHTLVFGDREDARSSRSAAIADELARGKFESRRSDAIVQEMWEKWVFIAAGAGITCLMRSMVGDIEAAGGAPLARVLLSECADVAVRAGFPPSEASLERGRATFTAPGSTLTASMYRDIERGGRTEGEHILGDLVRRGGATVGETSILRTAYTHVATYEVRRSRLEAERR